MKKLLESGALGLGTAILAKNPEMLRGFGMLGNLAADKMKERGQDEAQRLLDAGKEKPQEETAQMKKGGKVKSSASKRADGCAQRGKTKGRMV